MSFDFNNAALFAYMAKRRDIEDTNNIMITAGLAQGDAVTKTLLPMTVVNQAEELAKKNRELAELRKTQQPRPTEQTTTNTATTQGNANTAGNQNISAALPDQSPYAKLAGTLADAVPDLLKNLQDFVSNQKEVIATFRDEKRKVGTDGSTDFKTITGSTGTGNGNPDGSTATGTPTSGSHDVAEVKALLTQLLDKINSWQANTANTNTPTAPTNTSNTNTNPATNTNPTPVNP